jgi:hypothetical protein
VNCSRHILSRCRNKISSELLFLLWRTTDQHAFHLISTVARSTFSTCYVACRVEYPTIHCHISVVPCSIAVLDVGLLICWHLSAWATVNSPLTTTLDYVAGPYEKENSLSSSTARLNHELVSSISRQSS